MEIFLLNVVAFLRPIFFIDLDGTNAFDVAAIFTFGLLIAGYLVNAALKKDAQFSGSDFLIFAFVLWCVAVYVIYIDKSDLRAVARLVIPLLTYVIAKNVIRRREDYETILGLIIIGFVVPVLLSVYLIVTGRGIDLVDYWTGITRWQGAYHGAHTMGHNMAFVLMVMLTYLAFVKLRPSGKNVVAAVALPFQIGLVLLAGATLYCLYQSQVRTAVLGLLIFFSFFMWHVNRRLLVVAAVIGVVGVLSALPVLMPRFFGDVLLIEQGEFDADQLGSGRLVIWGHNTKLFFDLPIDRQLAGVGIGNKSPIECVYGGCVGGDGITDSHNDLLDVMIQTGYVGFALFLAIQIVIFKRVLMLPDRERFIFLSWFVAVLAMNLASNSYVTRFGLAQMYYIVLAYVEANIANYPERKEIGGKN